VKEVPHNTTDNKHYRAKITKRVDFAPDLWMIRIDPRAEFKFTPGQYDCSDSVFYPCAVLAYHVFQKSQSR